MAVSQEQRSEIDSLIRQGVSSESIAGKFSISTMSVAGYRAALTKSAGNQPTTGEAADLNYCETTTFGLERDLQMALRANIEQLEPALTITDGGSERIVQSGRIDITARDKDGCTVVIELKTGIADREAVGQILSYMGDLGGTDEAVRGILVAFDFPMRTLSAAKAIRNLQLRKYRYDFSFEAIQ